MNYPIPAKTYSSTSEMLENYGAINQRLMGSGAAPVSPSLVRLVTVRPQPHHPLAAPTGIPMVLITSETKQRVRDVLDLMAAEREANGFVDDDNFPDWKDIVAEVSTKHGVTRAEIMSPQRCRRIVLARQEIFYRLSTETTMSLPAIGRRIGDKDHTTVLHGVRKHRERMEAAAL